MSAQVSDAQSARALIYRGYVTGNLSVWQSGVDGLKAWCAAHPSDLDAHYEWALAEYGLIGGRLSGEGDRVIESVKELQDRVEGLLRQKSDWAACHALLGGLYGMRVHLSPGTTLYYGPKSVSFVDRAIELDPACPAGWIEKGNARYHAPAIFGGNKEKAVQCFAQAVELYRADANRKKEAWMYLYALAWLGLAHEANGNAEAAMTAYREALHVAPDFQWVKAELIPALKGQMGQN